MPSQVFDSVAVPYVGRQSFCCLAGHQPDGMIDRPQEDRPVAKRGSVLVAQRPRRAQRFNLGGHVGAMWRRNPMPQPKIGYGKIHIVVTAGSGLGVVSRRML